MFNLDTTLIKTVIHQVTQFLDSKSYLNLPKSFFEKARSRTAHYQKYECIKLVHVCPACGCDSFIPISRDEQISDRPDALGLTESYAVVCAQCGELEIGYTRSLLFLPNEKFVKGAFVGDGYCQDERFYTSTLFTDVLQKLNQRDEGIRQFVLGKK